MTTTTYTLEQRCYDTARKAGLQLVRDAIWKDDCCNWVSASVTPMGGRYQVVRNSCSPGIYSGLAGIALFLAHLNEFENDSLIDATLNGAVNTLLRYQAENKIPVFSYFNGTVGVADVLITLGTLKKKQKWLKAGWALLEDVRKAKPLAAELDVISGVAGAIPVLLRYYKQSRLEWLREKAEACGELLVNTAQVTGGECTWLSMPGSPGLTGYSHGNSGMCLALLELYQTSGHQRYLQVANAGWNYERNRFSPEAQNWPDLRQMPGAEAPKAAFQQAWCHGAPGMILPRLRAWQITGDSTFLHEAQVAIRTTHNGLFNNTGNFSLCHGMSGNADILFTAGVVLNDATLMKTAGEAARYGIEKVADYNITWPSGVSDPQGSNTVYENVSLMLGYAGTGYFYLRMAHPDKVPSLMLVN